MDDVLTRRFEVGCPRCHAVVTVSATGERTVRHCSPCDTIHLDYVMVGACQKCEYVLEMGVSIDADEEDEADA